MDEKEFKSCLDILFCHTRDVAHYINPDERQELVKAMHCAINAVVPKEKEILLGAIIGKRGAG